MKHRVSNLWIASLGALALCACSDGGDGEESGQAQALLHVDNAEAVASAVSTLGALASSADLFLAATEVPLPTATETESCPGGGAITYGYAVDVDPIGEISEGDRVVVDYDICRIGETTADGVLGYHFGPVTGPVVDGDAYEVEMDLGVEGLDVQTPEVGVRVNGLVTTAVTGDASGGFYTLGGWTRTTHTKGSDVFEEALIDCMITCDIDDLPGGSRVRTYTLDAKLESELLPTGELLTVETVTPFVAFDGESPYVGELKLTATDGSILRVVAVDNEHLELLLDTDGDDHTDFVIEVPWVQM